MKTKLDMEMDADMVISFGGYAGVGPAKSLGLPDPRGSYFGDTGLDGEYRKFCSTLQLGPRSECVRADSRFFELGKLPTLEAINNKLKLLNALLRPDAAMIETTRERLRCSETYRETSEEYERQLAEHIANLEHFHATLEAARFKVKTVAPECLDEVDVFYSSNPASSFCCKLRAHAWTEDWAVLLYYGDYVQSRANAFPLVFGFARRKTYPRSAARLLADEQQHTVYFDAEFKGNPLLAACWARYGDFMEIGLGRTLAALSDEKLALLRREYPSLTNSKLHDDIKAHGIKRLLENLQAKHA